jgi:hypothetical protein
LGVNSGRSFTEKEQLIFCNNTALITTTTNYNHKLPTLNRFDWINRSPIIQNFLCRQFFCRAKKKQKVPGPEQEINTSSGSSNFLLILLQ